VDLNRNKILVTGANGFVGSRLSKILEDKYPHQVLLMAHSELPIHRTDAWLQANLLDPDSYERVLPNVKTVIHLAQLNDAISKSSDRFFEQQQKLTENLIHSCLAFGVEEFIFLSSLTTTLRTPDPRVFSDEGSQSPWLPTAFAKSKYKEELLIKKAEAEGLKVLLFHVAPLLDTKEKEVELSEKSNIATISEMHYDVHDLNQCIVRSLSSNWWGERLLLAEVKTETSKILENPGGKRDSTITKRKTTFFKLFKGFFSCSKTEASFLQTQSFALHCQKTKYLLSAIS